MGCLSSIHIHVYIYIYIHIHTDERAGDDTPDNKSGTGIHTNAVSRRREHSPAEGGARVGDVLPRDRRSILSMGGEEGGVHDTPGQVLTSHGRGILSMGGEDGGVQEAPWQPDFTTSPIQTLVDTETIGMRTTPAPRMDTPVQSTPEIDALEASYPPRGTSLHERNAGSSELSSYNTLPDSRQSHGRAPRPRAAQSCHIIEDRDSVLPDLDTLSGMSIDVSDVVGALSEAGRAGEGDDDVAWVPEAEANEAGRWN